MTPADPSGSSSTPGWRAGSTWPSTRPSPRRWGPGKPARGAAVRLLPPTLSLGRFQRIKDRFSAPLLEADGVTLVRRPTGGHAVLHDNELTYSVMLSKEGTGTLHRGRAEKGGVRVHRACPALRGSRSSGSGHINSSQRGDIHNPDCFGSSGEYEITGAPGPQAHRERPDDHAPGHPPARVDPPGESRSAGLPLHPGGGAGGFPRPVLPERGDRPSHAFDEVQGAFARAFRSSLAAEDSELRRGRGDGIPADPAAKYASETWNLAC